MMAKKDKKSDNLGILSKIYHDDQKLQSNLSIIGRIRKYFSDPKKIEAWLSGAVLFFGFLGIIFGFFHFKNQIKNPYLFPESNQTIDLTNQPTTNQDLLGLRQKDTDQDGLSDYDELYLYNTSPYLPDSDSDGVTDAKEIARGSDPNCPIGQNCFAFIESSEESNGVDPVLLGGQADVTQLRQLLKQGGMSQEQLDSLTDDQLLAAYQQALTQDQGAAVDSTQPQTVDLAVSQIKDLTPNQIRELLKQAGVGEDVLSQVTDEELMQLVQETLQKQSQ